MTLDVVEHAEVDQGEPSRLATLELVERPLPHLEVDLGWHRRGVDEAAGLDAHPRGVPRVERPVLVEVRHVMARVPRRREAREPDDGLAGLVVVGRIRSSRARARTRGWWPVRHRLRRDVCDGAWFSARGAALLEIPLGAHPDAIFDALAEDDVEPNGRVPVVLVTHGGALSRQDTVPGHGPAERPEQVATVEELG